MIASNEAHRWGGGVGANEAIPICASYDEARSFIQTLERLPAPHTHFLPPTHPTPTTRPPGPLFCSNVIRTLCSRWPRRVAVAISAGYSSSRAAAYPEDPGLGPTSVPPRRKASTYAKAGPPDIIAGPTPRPARMPLSKPAQEYLSTRTHPAYEDQFWGAAHTPVYDDPGRCAAGHSDMIGCSRTPPASGQPLGGGKVLRVLTEELSQEPPFVFCSGQLLSTAPKDHQPPTANRQPPTANRQPPTATNHQPLYHTDSNTILLLWFYVLPMSGP